MGTWVVVTPRVLNLLLYIVRRFHPVQLGSMSPLKIWVPWLVTFWCSSQKVGYWYPCLESTQVQKIESTFGAFAALRADGKVIVWGDAYAGPGQVVGSGRVEPLV